MTCSLLPGLALRDARSGLRQSYLRISKCAAMMASRYAHAKQFKRHHRQLRLLRSRLGRIIRDIRRKITGRPELEAVFEAPIARAAQIRSQRQRQRGWKLYSFHAPRSNASSMKGCGSPGCRRAEVRSGSIASV